MTGVRSFPPDDGTSFSIPGVVVGYIDGGGKFQPVDAGHPLPGTGGGGGGAVTAVQLPAALGQTNIAGSLSITTASDQLGSSAAALTSVAANAASVQLLAANAARRRTVIVNDSASETLYVKFGATASATVYTFKLGPGDTYESPTQPVFTGRIDGIWSAAVGAARITEM